MTRIFKICSVILLFFALNSISTNTQAQCAMCQATVASNLDNGGETGKGLNSGIMYLLAAPYLAMAGIGYLWYKKYKRKSIAIDMKSDK